MASTEPVIDNPTEPSIKLPTEVPAETHTANPTASLTEPAKDLVSETPTEPSCENCTEPITGASVKPVSMPAPATSTETTESFTRTTDAPVSETSTKTTTELSPESCTAPTTESCDEPVNITTTETASEPTVEPLTQPASVTISEAFIKSSTEPSSESGGEASTNSAPSETSKQSGSEKIMTYEPEDTPEHLAKMEELGASGMLTERSTVPCSACSFSPERQRCCNYESQVKIFYEAGDRGVWALGSDLILKDRGPSCPTDENANIRFVKKNTTIPVPTVIAHHQESDGHALTVMNRVPGESLSEAWSKLTDNQKENIAKQTAKYLLQLRSLQSDRVEGVDGRPVYDGWLYKEKGRHNAPCPPMMSDDEVWNGLAVHLDPAVPESARRQLRRYMPPTQPFTFTHNDLTHVNIMVQSGEVVAILDWERAGFFPVWWEYVCTMATHAGKEDFEWNKLLRKHMPEMDDAHDFFLYYYHLCIDLESDAAKTFIAMSEEYDSEKDESEEDESKEIGS